MEFERRIISFQECHICGIYKIVPVEMMKHGWAVKFFAYQKPKGWVNWGNRVNPKVEYYDTFNEAAAACEAHAAGV